MAIQKGDIIKVQYEGRLEDGTIFDSTELHDGIPLKFEVGKGQLIRGFDEAVVGKNRVDGANSTYSVAWIKEVDDEFVTIDMNHPLAGKVLNFKLKIVETGCEPDPPEMCDCGCDCDHEH
ncbi:MAG: FKBP-type peptidyl-prolyl cis-trans isomerase [Candidatus Lokiarchaeota archaeon]